MEQHQFYCIDPLTGSSSSRSHNPSLVELLYVFLYIQPLYNLEVECTTRSTDDVILYNHVRKIVSIYSSISLQSMSVKKWRNKEISISHSVHTTVCVALITLANTIVTATIGCILSGE